MRILFLLVLCWPQLRFMRLTFWSGHSVGPPRYRGEKHRHPLVVTLQELHHGSLVSRMPKTGPRQIAMLDTPRPLNSQEGNLRSTTFVLSPFFAPSAPPQGPPEGPLHARSSYELVPKSPPPKKKVRVAANMGGQTSLCQGPGARIQVFGVPLT